MHMKVFPSILSRLPIPNEYKNYLTNILIPSSFSQLGEDAVIENLIGWLGLNPAGKGFYLDIGAHHPTYGSNTFKFYVRGCSGICIDVGDRKRRIFERIRARDVFIDKAI